VGAREPLITAAPSPSLESHQPTALVTMGLSIVSLQVIVLTGATGSGKTELAINLSRRCRDALAARQSVSLVDLDLKTPFFRSREQRRLLDSWGVAVIHPTAHSGADLPLMPPRLYELLKQPEGAVVLDVGGGGEGTRVLGGLSEYFEGVDCDHFAVINPRRPQTAGVRQIVRAVRDIASISRLAHTGLISNPNLGSASTVSQVCRDHELVVEAARKLGLPIRWLAVHRPLVEDFRVSCDVKQATPLLPIDRWMLPTWERSNGGDT